MSTASSAGEPAALAHDLTDRRAVHVLHHDEVTVRVGVVAGVVHLHDVRVHQLRGGQRLAPEARDEPVVLGEVLGQQLHGDLALEHAVERPVDGRHPAGAEALVEPVAARDLHAEHRHLRYSSGDVPSPWSPTPGTSSPVPPVSGCVWVCLVLLRLLLLGLLVLFALAGLVLLVPLRRDPPTSVPTAGSSVGAAGSGVHWSATSVSRRSALETSARLRLGVDTLGQRVDLLAEGGRLLARAGAVLALDALLDLAERRTQGAGVAWRAARRSSRPRRRRARRRPGRAPPRRP